MPTSRTVQSVDRAIALLRAIARSEAEPTLAELAADCGLERPTAWRLLLTLEANGLVAKAEPTRYRLAPGWAAASQPCGVQTVARIAHPMLVELSRLQQATASLAYVRTFSLDYVDQVDGPRFTSPRWEGALSLHASSPGKAVLAALPDAEWRAMVGTELERLTDTTITDLAALATELQGVRRRGYAVSRGEDVTYSNGASAAVRIRGRPVAAIDLWGPDRRVPEAHLDDLGGAVRAAAERLEAVLAEV